VTAPVQVATMVQVAPGLSTVAEVMLAAAPTDAPGPDALALLRVPYRSGSFAMSSLAARRARLLVSEALREWGLLPLVDEVQVCTSEFVTNALKHACSSEAGDGGDRLVSVWVWLRDSMVFVGVVDDDPTLPRLDAGAGVLAERGRGLALVEELADEWRAQPVEDVGKVVWAGFNPARYEMDGDHRAAGG
jgi:anti-sigma regulatory factor (Ser/Thr protein kinase)